LSRKLLAPSDSALCAGVERLHTQGVVGVAHGHLGLAAVAVLERIGQGLLDAQAPSRPS
jgi:hypothetical protein